MDSEAAIALARSKAEELLALLEALVAAPSPYGSSGAEAQQTLARFLESRGFSVDLSMDDPTRLRDHMEFTPPPPAPGESPPLNLVARPRAATELPLVFFAHVDTEPHAPCKPVVRDRRLYGPGAADDKAGLAAAAVAASLLASSLERAPLLASVHGKGGGARGSLPVFSRLHELEAALYVHPAETGRGMDQLKVASRGVLDVRLEVSGWRAAPREIGSPESASFTSGGDAITACFGLVESLGREDLAGCEVNLGRIEGGDSAGLVADRCRADLRILFDEPRTARELLANLARRWTARDGFRFEVKPAGTAANPASTAWDGPVARLLRRCVVETVGKEPLPYRAHLASDIRFPARLLHAPAIGIGSRAGGFYTAEEWVDLDDLVRLVAVLVLFGAVMTR